MMRTDCNGCSPISWRLASSHVPFFVASLPPSSWWKRTPSLYQTSGFHSLISSILPMCGDALLLLQTCLALSVPLGSEILSSYFLHSQYVLPFRMALLRMIAILVHLAMSVCNSVERSSFSSFQYSYDLREWWIVYRLQVLKYTTWAAYYPSYVVPVVIGLWVVFSGCDDAPIIAWPWQFGGAVQDTVRVPIFAIANPSLLCVRCAAGRYSIVRGFG